MKTLKQEQFLPISLAEAWDFFSSPTNLNKITPDDISFEITSDVPDRMYEGLIITYKIKPFMGIAMDWCTEVTHIQEGQFFVDEQRVGPYKMWHHEHHFREVENGIIMTDLLYYDIGKSIFGKIAGWIFVDNQVKKIFEFRKKILNSMLKGENNLIH